MEARSLVCAECGTQFEFTADEQQQFSERGFAPPRRCRPCRAAKRRRLAARTTEPASDEPPAPRQRADRPLHAADCTVCGAATEVPFAPDGVRPVYCLACLKQRTR